MTSARPSINFCQLKTVGSPDPKPAVVASDCSAQRALEIAVSLRYFH